MHYWEDFQGEEKKALAVTTSRICTQVLSELQWEKVEDRAMSKDQAASTS